MEILNVDLGRVLRGALEQRQAANLRTPMGHGLRQVHLEAGADLLDRSDKAS